MISRSTPATPPEARAKYRANAGDGRRAGRGSSRRAQVPEPTRRLTRRLGTALQAAGRAADAIAHYRRSLAELERLERPTPVDIYDMACCRSLISGAASEAGSGLTAAEGQAEAERAVAGVRRALDAGYSNLTWIRTGDPDLEPIRSRPTSSSS